MSYFAIVILVLVGIIIIAAIFKPGFQEKIFGGSEGEAKIAGILSVRGVSFVVLIIGLVGVAAYFEINNNPEMSVDKAAKYLKSSHNAQLSVRFLNKDSIDIMMNGTWIGRIKQPADLSVKKSFAAEKKYDVILDNTAIGNLKLDVAEKSLIYENGNIYWKDSAYNIANSNFWFKIENIESINIGQGKNIARYFIRFGEGKSKENVKWSPGNYEYGKTDNGQLPAAMKIINNANWTKSYAIALGAGLFGQYNGKYYIEIINAMLVEVRIEK